MTGLLDWLGQPVPLWLVLVLLAVLVAGIDFLLWVVRRTHHGPLLLDADTTTRIALGLVAKAQAQVNDARAEIERLRRLLPPANGR